MKFFDSHAHLTNTQVFADIENILTRARQALVTNIVNICTDIDTLDKGLKLSTNHPWIFNTCAITPHDVESQGEMAFPIISNHAKKGDLVAVGETGLDYYYEHSPKQTQKKFLVKYLHLALECHLPVVIHCRNAFRDFFEILDSEYLKSGEHAPGVLHCFTGTLEEAKEVIDRGWYLSLSGIVTFKKSEELRSVAKMVPLEQLLIETDTPYLAPQSRRGKPNEPAYLVETADLISKLRGLPLETIASKTTENAQRLFNIPNGN